MDDYLGKVYLWLGIHEGTQNEFESYFKLDYSVEGDFDDPNYKACGFCKDIGENWYDEDFIGFLKYDEKVKIINILDDVPVDEDDKENIKEMAKEKDLDKVNAVYWYSGDINEPNREKNYNGLRYIGGFHLD